MKVLPQTVLYLVLAGTSLLSSASPIDIDHEKITKTSLSAINGSLVMLPKCDVLGCTPVANASSTSNHALRKRVVDRAVDPIFDFDEEQRFQDYINQANRWLLVLRETPGHSEGPLLLRLHLQAGHDIRRSPVARLDDGRDEDLSQFQGLEVVDFFVPPFVIREFARIHGGQVSGLPDCGRPEDLRHLEQAMDPNNLDIRPDPETVSWIQHMSNYFGSDVSTHQNRQRAFAGEPVDFDRLGRLEIRRLLLLEDNLHVRREYVTIANRIGGSLVHVYPDSGGPMAHAFLCYAQSLRQLWIDRLRQEFNRRRGLFEPAVFERPRAGQPILPLPIPPSIYAPDSDSDTAELIDDGLGGWDLTDFLPNNDLSNLDTETELIRHWWLTSGF